MVGPVASIGVSGDSSYTAPTFGGYMQAGSALGQALSGMGDRMRAEKERQRQLQEQERQQQQAQQLFSGFGQAAQTGGQEGALQYLLQNPQMAGDDSVKAIMEHLVPPEGGDRERAKDASGRLRYVDDGSYVFSDYTPEVEAKERERAKDASGRWRHVDDGSYVFPDYEEPPPEPGKPMSFRMPDETVRTVRSNSPEVDEIMEAGGFPVTVRVNPASFGDIGLEKSTAAKLEKDAISAGDALVRLNDMRESFDPAFLTMSSKAKGWVARQLESAGIDVGDDLKEHIAGEAAFKLDVIDNMNRFISDITGAEMSEQEAKRITAGIPNMEDSPTEFVAKFNRSLEKIEGVLGRKQEQAIGPGEGTQALDTPQLPGIGEVIAPSAEAAQPATAPPVNEIPTDSPLWDEQPAQPTGSKAADDMLNYIKQNDLDAEELLGIVEEQFSEIMALQPQQFQSVAEQLAARPDTPATLQMMLHQRGVELGLWDDF